MPPVAETPSEALDELVDALDQADASLRALYRQLAEDPDLAAEREPRLRELHSQRLALAQRAGLAMLAHRRGASTSRVEGAPALVAAAADAAMASSGLADAAPSEAELVSTLASEDEVSLWKSAARTGGLGVRLSVAPPADTLWPVVLYELMQAVGPLRDLEAGVEVVDETDALDAIGSPQEQARWALLPRTAQQPWLSMLVARTRALKELPTASDAARERIKQIIGRYPPWAKEHLPGHVNGMQVRHAPEHGSWARDARACWRALDELLGEQAPVRLPRPPPSSRTKLQRADDSDEAPDSESGLPWRLLPLVRGRKAVMFGGDPREANRERLERALQLESLEWPPIDGPRKVEAAVERIRQGSYGLVLVLSPFVFHKQSNPIIEAAKDSGVTWALVDGYGLAAVKLGLERFFGRSAGLTARQE